MHKKKSKKLPKIQYNTGGDLIYGTNVPTTFTNVSNVSDEVANIGNTPYFTSLEDLNKMNKVGYKPESTVVYHQDPNNPKSVTLDNYSKVAQAQAAMDKLITPSGVAKVKKPFGGFINSGITNIAKGLGVNDKTANIIGSGVATATGFIPGMQDNLFQAGDLAGDIMNTSGNKKVANAGQTISAMSPLLNMIPMSPTPKAAMAMGGKIKYNEGGLLTEFEGNPHEKNGIPLGDSNNEVEGGESANKQYIYSDKIKLPWNKKATFADESKRIARKYKDKEEDALAKKSMQIELDKLRDMQETAKGEMISKAQKIMQLAGGGQHQMPDGSMMNNNQMAYGGGITSSGYGIYPVENTDENYLGKENWQYENEGNIPQSRLSKNYLPEEQIQIQNLTNQLNSGKINKQQFDEALSSFGNNDSFNESHVAPAYREQFLNNQANENTTKSVGADNPLTSAVSNAASQVAKSATDSPFNDALTTGQKLMPYLPALGQAATLIGGATKTDYAEMTPQFIDLKNQRTAAEKQAAIAKLTTNRNIRNTAGNSGRALSNMVTSGAGIQSNLGDQLGQSYMNEANTNSQIANQASQFNTQIKNDEINANEMNKSRWQEQMIATLANTSGAYMGVGKDQRAYASNNRYNEIMGQNLGTEDYIIGYDSNGLPITKFRPRT